MWAITLNFQSTCPRTLKIRSYLKCSQLIRAGKVSPLSFVVVVVVVVVLCVL